MYDLIVIGSGPAGEKGDAQAAYFGKRVALIEREPVLGGASVNTGTIPSKTLRETVLNLSGWRERGFYGRAYRVKKDIAANLFDIPAGYQEEAMPAPGSDAAGARNPTGR